jgi:protocatechuate 3,4-dioxygenase beta subunit
MPQMTLTLLTLTSALAQLPASPDPKPLPISGVVVDRSGTPIANAKVWLIEEMTPEDDRPIGFEERGPVSTWSNDRDRTPSILVHTRTDAAGRIQLEVPAEAVARRSPRPMALWAAVVGKEARVAWHPLSRVVLADDPPVRIELNSPARAEVSLLGPDREPVAGARIIPIRTGELPIPEPLGQALVATTDVSGRAVIAGLAPESLGGVRVEARGFGIQTLEILDSRFPIPDTKRQPSPKGAVSLTLAPVGRLVGRFVASGDEPFRGVTVRATSQVGGYDGSGQGGSAVVACDERGRFEIPAIAAGSVTLDLEFDPEKGTILRPWPISKILVRAGRTTEVAIPLHPTVKVQSLVREKKTERPIAGVTVLWNSFFDGPNMSVSGAKGMFRGFLQREDILAMPYPIGIPSPFFTSIDWTDARQDLPPRGVDEQTLAPFELSRGVDVSGTVVDEHGQPVAGAAVEGIGTASIAWAQLTRSDRASRFVLHGINPRAELRLTAWDGLAASTDVAVGTEDLSARPITLTVSPGHATSIAGRVVGLDGKPIAGATVRIWRQARAKDQAGRAIVIDSITAGNGSAVLRTDAQGRYRTLQRFPVQWGYHAEVSAPGRMQSRSPVVTPSTQTRDLPPVVLRRLRTIEGQVVDRQSQPIHGALVFQSGDGPLRTETTSDDQGHFRLPGVLEGPALVFAQKDGFRLGFVGCSASTGSGDPPPVRVTLSRTGEPPGAVYKTLPSALPAEEEKALAHRLIQPHADHVLAHGTDQEKYRLLLDLAQFDPSGALERLETAKLSDPDSIRITAAEAIAKESLDEAMAIVESYATADVRALAYMAICNALPDVEPARAKPLIDQAIVNMRAAKHLNNRLYLLAQIVGQLIELGDVERARSSIREGQEMARAAFQGQPLARQLATFAGQMLRVDPAKELAVFEGFKRQALEGKVTVRAFGYDRHYAQAAYHFAVRDPATAEKLVRLISFTLPRPANGFVQAVCVRMAPADLPHARKLVDLITNDERVLRPYTLGLMASAIAASDKPAANRLLDEAYAKLEQLAANGWTSQFASICGVAGALLPVVEQVDASRLPDVMARALALRPPTGGRNESAYIPEQTASLAMAVARYDRGLAARILQPELDGLGAAPNPAALLSYTAFEHASEKRVLAALALIDPRQAIERIQRLPDETDPFSFRGQARIEMARLLTVQGVARWNEICERQLILWTPLEGIR